MTTTLTQPAKKDESADGFYEGDILKIGKEAATITGSRSLRLAHRLRGDHPAGALVTRVEDEEQTSGDATTSNSGPRYHDEIEHL